jgi:phosphoribosylaminoimidazolecarboxamide formyltransferase/IMP cyclohydrolase
VIALNRRVDKTTAEAIHEQFAEIVLARGFDDDALEVFADKPNMRILDDRERRLDVLYEPAFRQVIGGLLVQDRDTSNEDRDAMEVVSERRPSEEEWSELLFAWRVCKHVKSNAIVLARDGATIGLGAGQMSRIDSVRIALEKTQTPAKGAVLASDAFFPFPDGPEIALEQGITAIIQPGGSIRDPVVVEAVDRAGAAMVFTGRRHFRH